MSGRHRPASGGFRDRQASPCDCGCHGARMTGPNRAPRPRRPTRRVRRRRRAVVGDCAARWRTVDAARSARRRPCSVLCCGREVRGRVCAVRGCSRSVRGCACGRVTVRVTAVAESEPPFLSVDSGGVGGRRLAPGSQIVQSEPESRVCRPQRETLALLCIKVISTTASV